jgi:sterol desaturase/sphingolipid hydroxylase (fatty acid hydroxylase superfamily)
MKDLPTPLILVAMGVLLFVGERFFPLRKATRSLLARLLVNLAISVLTFITAVGLLQPAVHSALRWSAAKSFGVVHLVALPSPIAFVLSLLLMDLTFYYWHLANHRVPFLWRFHR